MNCASANRILHVPRRFVADEWGGTETVILEIARQQQRASMRPEIFTSHALTPVRRELIGGIPVRRFNYCYPFFGLSAADRAALDLKAGNLLSLSLFTALLTAPAVRLYHAHTLKRLGGEVRTAARWRRKPFVVSLHGGVFDVPAAEREQILRPIAQKLEWGKPFGALFGSRRVLEDADYVICVGRSEMEKARQALPHDRIAYLPNGVDCARFAAGDGAAFRAKHGIPADAFLVLNISRIDPQKNQLLLVEAFGRLRAHCPNAQLLIIGPVTDPAYAAQLRELIAAHGLGASARLLPGLRNDQPDLIGAYHACNVFVLPSRHEPFGIVALEAWSAGRPVVASKVGGLGGLIRDDETGWFINPNADTAADDLAGKLQQLAGTPEIGARLAAAGQREARTRYDWPEIHRQLEQLYQAAEAHCARRTAT